MSLADKAQGRVIHMLIDVTLKPPPLAEIGEIDEAIAIGEGLIREAFLMIKNAGEAEGFEVDGEARQVIY